MLDGAAKALAENGQTGKRSPASKSRSGREGHCVATPHTWENASPQFVLQGERWVFAARLLTED